MGSVDTYYDLFSSVSAPVYVLAVLGTENNLVRGMFLT